MDCGGISFEVLGSWAYGFVSLLTPVFNLQVTITVSSVLEDGKKRPALSCRGGVALGLSFHPSAGEGSVDSTLLV